MPAGWIEQYGHWAILLGAVLEGETVLIASGYGISGGYLQPVPAFVSAVIGGSLGDLIYYLLGRRFGARLIRSLRPLRRLQGRAILLLRRWGRTTAFLTRFAYGLRIVLPMSIGTARYPLAVFLGYNLLGSITFSTVYLSLGYLFGEAIEELLTHTRDYEHWILLGLAAIGATVWAIREWKLFHSPEPPKQPPA